MTTFEQLPVDQQLIALALLEAERIQDKWIVGYYKATTRDGHTFQGKGQFKFDNYILETPTSYEFVSKNGTYYTVDRKNMRWVSPPIPAIQKDHLVNL